MARTVAEGMWEMLASAGVRRCYGIVGDALNPVIDALRRNGSVDFVHVRHEEYGVFAAVAEARLTGNPVAPPHPRRRQHLPHPIGNSPGHLPTSRAIGLPSAGRPPENRRYPRDGRAGRAGTRGLRGPRPQQSLLEATAHTQQDVAAVLSDVGRKIHGQDRTSQCAADSCRNMGNPQGYESPWRGLHLS